MYKTIFNYSNTTKGQHFKKRKRKQTSNSQATEDEDMDIDVIADPEALQTLDVQMQDLQSAIDTNMHLTAATGQQTSQLNREVTSEFVEKLVSLHCKLLSKAEKYLFKTLFLQPFR